MRRIFTVVAVALVVAVLSPGPAYAAPGESITSYDTRIGVRADGTLEVTETIRYAFDAPRHGIFRKIPTRYRFDGTRDRVYPVDEVHVTRDGYPEQLYRTDEGGYTVLRIGNPNSTVTGTHTYTIWYRVQGALNHVADHEELYWNAVGSEWDVPVHAATVTVTGPAAVGRVTCYTGPSGSDRTCASATASGDSATFGQPDLAPDQALTVVVAFPPGTVHSGPILAERHDLAAAFRLTPWTVGGALGVALLGTALMVGYVWRVGRDRRFVGTLPGLVPGRGEPAVEERRPVLGAPPVSVEFVPPDNIRPGQVGTLWDERADLVDVTATILDLAVRKHLRIRELRPNGATTPTDWELVKLTGADKNFLPYERTLFRGLFDGRDQVRLSELRGTFRPTANEVRAQLDADLVTQGWYRRSPRAVRLGALGTALLMLVGAGAVTVVLAIATQVALLGLGLVAAALVFLVLHRRVPARTGTGSAMLERVKGLRLYIATTEAEQIRFEEREQIFSRYLPYAVVFGLAHRWAATFAGIDTVALGWYEGPAVGWSGVYLASSFDSFTSISVGSVGASPPSVGGSSGFSGGGFSGGFSDGGGGGGGGGSW